MQARGWAMLPEKRETRRTRQAVLVSTPRIERSWASRNRGSCVSWLWYLYDVVALRNDKRVGRRDGDAANNASACSGTYTTLQNRRTWASEVAQRREPERGVGNEQVNVLRSVVVKRKDTTTTAGVAAAVVKVLASGSAILSGKRDKRPTCQVALVTVVNAAGRAVLRFP